MQHVGRADRVVLLGVAPRRLEARRPRAADLPPVEGEPVRAEAVLLARRRPLGHKGRQLVGAPRRDDERVRPGDAVREGPQERKVRVDERDDRRALEVDRSVVEEVLHAARLVVEVVRLARRRVLVELRRDVEREARARAVEGRVPLPQGGLLLRRAAARDARHRAAVADDVGAVEDDLALPVLVGRAVRAEDDAHARRPRRVALKVLSFIFVLVLVQARRAAAAPLASRPPLPSRPLAVRRAAARRSVRPGGRRPLLVLTE